MATANPVPNGNTTMQSTQTTQPSHDKLAQPARHNADEIRPTSAPPVDVYENDDEILVVADMPGARPDSVQIKLEKEELFISANRETDVSGQLLFGNRRDCEYRRAFLVPRGIDAVQITAEMTQGVLTVHMPKSAAVKPRTIAVTAHN
jgi:HSP20 family protein